MTTYNIVASTNEATVVAECKPSPYTTETYQSEAELEREFIKQLETQGYQLIAVDKESTLINNLRLQLEALNHISFSDDEWQRFYGERSPTSVKVSSKKPAKFRVTISNYFAAMMEIRSMSD